MLSQDPTLTLKVKNDVHNDASGQDVAQLLAHFTYTSKYCRT